MPAPIKAQFEDPRFVSVVQAIGPQKGDFPYVLLPVRIETKFVKAERQPITQPLTIEKALEIMQHLCVQGANITQTQTGAGIATYTTEVLDAAKALAAMPLPTDQQVEWIKLLRNGVQNALVFLLEKGDAKFINLIKELGDAYNKLSAAIDALPKNPPAGQTPPPPDSQNVQRNLLKLRIYPDDVFVQTHEPALTQGEQDSGRSFWKYWWAASNHKELQMAAWKTLCTAAGSKRASWIARSLHPGKIDTARNGTSFSTKPSAALVKLTDDMNAAFESINKLPFSKPAPDLFATIRTNTPFKAFLEHCNEALAAIQNGKTEQDYLLEEAKSSLEKLQPLLATLESQTGELDPVKQTQFEPEITDIHNSSAKFASVQALVNSLPAIDYTQFTDALPEPFDYPAIATKPKDWNSAPHTDCLPSRFAVLTRTGDAYTHLAFGNLINTQVQLGLDPNKFNDPAAFSIDANGNLLVEPGLAWMTDYEEALKTGLAVTIEITEKEFKEGFDSVLVMGVREGADAAAAKGSLEKLFTNHIYSPDGLSFLKVGTPTNNTENKKSFLEQDNDIEQRFDLEINNKFFGANEPDKMQATDGKWLTDALGFDPAVFQYANGSGNTEIANALVMNRALWHAGAGHFMEDMADTLFTYDNIRRTEDFFTNYCFGRGMLPSLQIGRQPYGILVTSAFSRWEAIRNNAIPALTYNEVATTNGVDPLPPELEQKLQQRFDVHLMQVLQYMNGVIWKSLLAQVPHAGTFFNGDQQQKFMHMLGLHATSLEYFYRYSINAPEPNSDSQSDGTKPFNPGDFFNPESLAGPFDALMAKNIFAPSFDFADERPDFATGKTPAQVESARKNRIFQQFTNSRVYAGRLIQLRNHIPGNIIEPVELSHEHGLSKLPGRNEDYIDWLLSNHPNTLYGHNEIGNPAAIPSQSLLFLMLRQSLLQAYQEAALSMMQKENLITHGRRREMGNKNYFMYTQVSPNIWRPLYLTKWHLLFESFTGLNTISQLAFSGKPDNNPFYKYMTMPGSFGSMANYMDDVRNPGELVKHVYRASHKQDFNKLTGVRNAIQQLKRISTADLEILFAEQMDMLTYRLDAWTLGMANRRLLQLREKNSQGLYMGAYAYVENLRPAAQKSPLTDSNKLKDFKLAAGKPVYHEADNQGFVHAPSINQAITAAVLRSAYKANGDEDIHNRLAVNISSARVRMALNLIEGIRNGQELGAILGFQFERGLHERYGTVELDKFIQPFRKAYPLTQQVLESAGGTPAYVSQVVNGAEMLQDIYKEIQWLQFPTGDTLGTLLKASNYSALPGKIKNLIQSALQTGDNATKVFDSIIEEIDRMADAFDALGDLAISESVYQIVQGNHVRAAAMLTALAEHKNIPDPQIIQTNRSGTVVTHRLVLNLPAHTDLFTTPPGWEGRGSYRSFTEPSLNYWLGTILGDQHSFKCTVTLKGRENLLKETLSLAELNWQPIDFFSLPGGEEELKQVVQNWYRLQHKLFDAPVEIDPAERGADWNAGDRTIRELFLQLAHVRNLLSNARMAGAGDLLGPDAEADPKNPGNYDGAEYGKRVRTAYQSLQMLNQAISQEAFVAAVLSGSKAVAEVVAQTGDFDKIMQHLNNALLMGIPHAGSLQFSGSDEQARFAEALQHLLNIYKESASRKSNAHDLLGVLDSSQETGFKIEKLGELAKLLFGKQFTAIPLYMPANAVNINAQLTLPPDKHITRQLGTGAAENWLQSIARVRKRMQDLALLRQAEDMNDLAITPLQPVQFPFSEGDYWLGMQYPDSYKPAEDKLSLVLVNDTQFSAQTTQSGLIIDEWLEIIPGREETSGIAFHFNQPDVTAPQAILLAVHPRTDDMWTFDDLVHTVDDTIALAKNRIIEPDLVNQSVFNHALPAMAAEVTPSTSFINQPANPLGNVVEMDFAQVKNPTT
ncbi:MAG: hypothetical protein INR73_21645 [Williamsia sp.]|nr:hypothetical protein [Williamsia sp.]